jgi:uncharacterized surface protein with fasciclin (FAS1) repeats
MEIKEMTKTKLVAAAALAALITVPACAPVYSSGVNEPMKNIVQVAAENGNFNTLVAAVKAAGLVETLSSPGPFTVFAPTDAAFAKLPKGTIDALIADKDKLTAILTYHVLSGKVVASDITRANGANPTTVNGQKLDIEVRGGKVFVNQAEVTMADVAASNGVIHVIDAVLIPSAQPAMSTR